jgi:hypothetical protein
MVLYSIQEVYRPTTKPGEGHIVCVYGSKPPFESVCEHEQLRI